MQLNEYVPLAIVTESQIEQVQYTSIPLVKLIDTAIEIGNLVDLAKKHVYYGKAIDEAKWNQMVIDLRQNVGALFTSNGTDTISANDLNPRLFHASVGIFTESVEMLQALMTTLKSGPNGDALDVVNFTEEIADAMWYTAIAIDETKASWGGLLDTNIAKLKSRYGDKFTAAAALNRDLAQERKILEDGSNKN